MPGSLCSKPPAQHGHTLGTALSLRTQADWASGALQGSSGISPALRALNLWHHLSLSLPFTPAHICSCSRVTKSCHLSAGGKERLQRQQWLLCWSSSGKNTAQGEAWALPGSCQLRLRGQLGDRCTRRGDSSHQLPQSLSSRCWGGKRAQICASPQGEQPGEWEGKTPVGDQSRGKK